MHGPKHANESSHLEPAQRPEAMVQGKAVVPSAASTAMQVGGPVALSVDAPNVELLAPVEPTKSGPTDSSHAAFETKMGFRGNLAFCSNFYQVTVVHQGLTFQCGEAAFQAAKFTDPDFRARFVDLDGPAAKRLGKTRHASFRKDWNQVRIQAMREILASKFAEPILQQSLLATGSIELTETNTWGDKFWGVCGSQGENHLGKLLMELRTKFRENN